VHGSVFSELARTAERCKNGHARTLENTFYDQNGKWLVRRCKECRKAVLARSMPSADQMRRVFQAMHHGQIICDVIGKNNPASKLIREPILRNFMRANPSAARRIQLLSEKNRLQHRSTSNKRSIAAPALLRNDGLDAYEVVRRATAHLSADDRDDVMSRIFVAIGEGRLTLAQVSTRVGNFLKDQRRRPRVFGDARYSLDNPVGDDSNMTWLDIKADADRLWG
jgi:hypothetical protein